jgi:hypothetical protein
MLSAANEGSATMSAIPIAQRDPSRVLTAFRVFLRVYGVLTLAILWRRADRLQQSSRAIDSVGT